MKIIYTLSSFPENLSSPQSPSIHQSISSLSCLYISTAPVSPSTLSVDSVFKSSPPYLSIEFTKVIYRYFPISAGHRITTSKRNSHLKGEIIRMRTHIIIGYIIIIIFTLFRMTAFIFDIIF